MSAILTRISKAGALERIRSQRVIRFAPSTRARILGSFVVLMAIALVFGLFVQRIVLRNQLDSDVRADLNQEVVELATLAEGRDPNTGQPFGGDIAAIFDTFLRRNIPVEGEALFALIGGEPYAATVAPVDLFEDPDVVAEWASINSSTRAEIDTDAGPAQYLATPIQADGETAGVFVVAIFLEERQDQIDRVITDGAIVYGSIFVGASVLSWFVAGRVLRPVSLLTQTARDITDANWSERIPVEGDDEIAELARTFNDMLGRLEMAFDTQRRFIDDAGHELRTPITIIRGHLELLSSDADERDETMRLVVDELDRMTRIVEELLLLAKSEQADFLDPHPLDVEELTQDVAANAAALAPRKWESEASAHVVMVADRQRLTQALMNLARNAAEHTAEGATITIGSRAAGSEVYFWVRDEGEGIPSPDQHRIFERFSRAGSGRGNAEGAGLGLAIVRAIVSAHGGRISVDSALGKGSTFTLVLPVSGPEREAL